jgi:hypothetical protein
VNAARLPWPSATIESMTLLAGVLMAGAIFQGAPRPTHFEITAAFNPGRGAAPAEVAVQFVAKDPDVKINEVPAPRLKLETGPLAVVPPVRPTAPAPAPAPAKAAPSAAGPGNYLDLTLPVTFPVTLAPATPRGSHEAKGAVTYFYCSKREGWCRKGVAEVSFPIVVP